MSPLVPTDADATFEGLLGGDFGWSVAGIGDWNRDADLDIAFGDPRTDFGASNTGAVFVAFGSGTTRFFGTYGLDDTTADCMLFGQEEDRAGWAITGVPNWDGSHDALAVGLPWSDGRFYDDNGSVYVFHRADYACPGPSGIGWWHGADGFVGASDDAHLGYSLDSVPSLDGNLSGDLVVGSPGHVAGTTLVGRAYWIAGATSPYQEVGYIDEWSVPMCGPFLGESNQDRHANLGTSVAGGRSAAWLAPTTPDDADVWDVDAAPDIAVGLPTFRNGSLVDAGAVWVYDGADILAFDPMTDLCVHTPAFTIVGTQADGLLGSSVDLIDDGRFEGPTGSQHISTMDAVDEVITAAPRWDASSTDPDRGAVRIILSSH